MVLMKGVLFMLAFLLQIASGIIYFALHITGIGSFPPALTAKEERELLERMSKGDDTAREKLIEHNLRLVAHIAKKYTGIFRDGDDAVSIGTIGLIKGISSYNFDKKTKLSTYISRCIENAIRSQWLF